MSTFDKTRSMKSGPTQKAVTDGESRACTQSVADAWDNFQTNPTDANFHGFHALTSGLVYTICYRILNENVDEAQDAFQSVYSSLMEEVRSAGGRIPKEEIEIELRRLARRQADTRRKRISRGRGRVVPLDEIDLPESNRPSARENLSHQEIQSLLSEILETLPDTLRLPIVLYYYHGMTQQEIAEVVGSSRSKVTKTIHKGLELLRARLRKEGIRDAQLAVILLPRAAHWLEPPAALSAESVLSGMADSACATSGAIETAGTSSSFVGAGGISVKKLAVAAIVLLGLFGLFFTVRVRIGNPVAPPPPTQAGPTFTEDIASAPPTEPIGEQPVVNSEANPSAMADAPAAARGLFGRVVSLYTQQPLEGVTVQLRKATRGAVTDDSPLDTILTDARGEFRFEAGESGYYAIKALASDPWQSVLRETYVRGDSENRMPDIELYRLGMIRGRVVQSPDREGIPGLRIQLVNALNRDWPETTTDAQGSFEFAGLTWTHYDLWILERNSFAVRVDLTRGETREIEIPFAAAVLQGRIYREQQPYGFAEVRIYPEGSDLDASQVCATRLDGTYRLGGLAPGRYRIEATSQETSLKRQKAVEWVDVGEEGIAENDLALPSGVLGGRVVDEQDTPASGALVLIRDSREDSPAALALAPLREIRTHADGGFSVTGLPPGEYWATALNASGQRSRAVRVRVPASGLSPPVHLAMQSTTGADLISKVYDGQNGQPLADAWCFVSSLDGPCEHRGIRGDDGVLRIASLPAGDYEVEIGAYGYCSSVHRVSITPEKPVVLRDTLYEAGAFRWTFKTREGDPEPGVACWIAPCDNFITDKARQGETNADGCWIVRGLHPGNYRATAVLPEGEISEVVTIRPRDITSRRIFTSAKKIATHAK